MTGATDVTDATKLGLLDALTGFVGYRPPEQLEMFRASVRRLLDDVGGAELTRVLAHVAGDGPEAEQQYCPAERFARDVAPLSLLGDCYVRVETRYSPDRCR